MAAGGDAAGRVDDAVAERAALPALHADRQTVCAGVGHPAKCRADAERQAIDAARRPAADRSSALHGRAMPETRKSGPSSSRRSPTASTSSCSPGWWPTTSRSSSRKRLGHARRDVQREPLDHAARRPPPRSPAAPPRASGSNGSTSWATSLTSPASFLSTRPRTITILSTSTLLGVRRVGGVEDEHLDLALEVVERGEHHRVALARADALALGDHAADGHPLAVLLVAQLGERAVDLRAQRVAHLLERVAGEEQAERLLLPLVELLALVRQRRHRQVVVGRPRRRRRRRGRRSSPGRAARPAGASRRPPGPAASRSSMPGAGAAERVERAALDQRLDRLLVHGAAVDAAAEVPDRRERAVLVARGDDRLDGLRRRRS